MADSSIVRHGYPSPQSSEATETNVLESQSRSTPGEPMTSTEPLTAPADAKILAEKYAGALTQLIKNELQTQTDSAGITKVGNECIALVEKDLEEFRTTESERFVRLRDDFNHWFIRLEARTEQGAANMALSSLRIFMTTAAFDTGRNGLYALEETDMGTCDIDGWPESGIITTPDV